MPVHACKHALTDLVFARDIDRFAGSTVAKVAKKRTRRVSSIWKASVIMNFQKGVNDARFGRHGCPGAPRK